MNWKEARLKFLWFLQDHCTNEPEGVQVKWINVIYIILFPFDRCKHYHAPSDIYTIEGVKITGSFFRHMKGSVGECFKIVEQMNGFITLKRIEESTDGNL